MRTVQALLGKQLGVSEIARATGLSRQTIYRIKGDPAGTARVLEAWKPAEAARRQGESPQHLALLLPAHVSSLLPDRWQHHAGHPILKLTSLWFVGAHDELVGTVFRDERQERLPAPEQAGETSDHPVMGSAGDYAPSDGWWTGRHANVRP